MSPPRMNPRAGAAVLALTAGLLLAAPLAASPWAKVRTTASGPAAAIGGASNGCLQGAATLAETGRGFVSVRRERNRFYGHPDTVAFIEDLGAAAAARTGRLLMIGDLSQPRGGLMSSKHVSHQNGLDVDVWLTLAESAREAARLTPEGSDPPSMVRARVLTPSPAWGPEQVWLIRTTAMDPRVDRVLVNPGIKRALCDSEGDAAWLRKLRPWWGHDAHMHIRLKCPADSPQCEAQRPVPAGSGCGSDLAWWFSEEATAPKPKAADSKPAPRPTPPAACRPLLTGGLSGS